MSVRESEDVAYSPQLTVVYLRVVLGPVNGTLRKMLSRIKEIHNKVGLSFAIIVGDVFISDDDEALTALLNASLPVPVATYFTVGNHPLPPRVIKQLKSSDELCPNLFYLGRKGLLTTSEGVRIVTLGGRLTEQPTVIGRYEALYTQDDARELQDNHNADIFITNQWPLGVQNGSRHTLPHPLPAASQCISHLCSILRPRYHFSNSPNAFFEREPFVQPPLEDSSTAESLTRFYSLASFDNPAKHKSVYAFNLDLSKPAAFAEDRTRSPFAAPAQKRRVLPDQSEPYSRFAIGQSKHPRPPKRRRNGPVSNPNDPRNCFFCVGNDNCATHLICSVGAQAYLSVPKGPISLPTTFPNLGIPAHIQIIPLAHVPTSATIEADEDGYTSEETFAEMRQYHKALCKFLHVWAMGLLGAVIWEVSRRRLPHFFHQFLPAPVKMARDGLVEAAFKLVGEKDCRRQFEHCDPDHIFTAADGDYFRVWIWTPPTTSSVDPADVDGLQLEDGEIVSLFMRLGSEEWFDANLGRKVMTGLLNLEQRNNWQDCVQLEEEESKDRDEFEKAFKPFDFTRVDI